jgi:copper homeostasis protein CutC
VYEKVLEKIGSLKGAECFRIPEILKPDEEAIAILNHAEIERIRTYGKKIPPAGYTKNYEDLVRLMGEALTIMCGCDIERIRELFSKYSPMIEKHYDEAHRNALDIVELAATEPPPQEFYYLQEHLVKLRDTWEEAMARFLIRCIEGK